MHPRRWLSALAAGVAYAVASFGAFDLTAAFALETLSSRRVGLLRSRYLFEWIGDPLVMAASAFAAVVIGAAAFWRDFHRPAPVPSADEDSDRRPERPGVAGAERPGS